MNEYYRYTRKPLWMRSAEAENEVAVKCFLETIKGGSCGTSIVMLIASFVALLWLVIC